MIRTITAFLIAMMVAPGASRAQTNAPSPPSSERAVLYEENPSNAQGSSYVGTVSWSTGPDPSAPPEIALFADVSVPRGLLMKLRIQRNTDKKLPATHTMQVDFTGSAQPVENVPGILMKETEQSRGSPLGGLSVKVTNQMFLIGLSSKEPEAARNLELLRTREWIDIPIVYGNGRRAILAVSKGASGQAEFAKVMSAWQQTR